MIHRVKVVVMAALAVLAFSAVAASAASAGSFDSTASTTKLSGTQTNTHEFKTKAGTVTCEEASFPGLGEGTNAATITVNPVYAECETTILGEAHEVHVNMNTCDYTFSAGAATEGGIAGSVAIECEGSNEIEVQITGLESLCTVTVPAQTVGGITYSNTGSGTGATVDVNANVTTLKYIQHGIFCPGNSFSSTKTFTTGVYTGDVEESGESSEGGAAGISVTAG